MFPRRNDIDVIWQNSNRISYLRDRHRRAPLEDFRHHAFMLCGQMDNHHKGQARIFRSPLKEPLQGIKTTCGATQTDDGGEQVFRSKSALGHPHWLGGSHSPCIDGRAGMKH